MKIYFKSSDSNGNRISFLSTAKIDESNIKFKDMSSNNTFISLIKYNDKLVFERTGDIYTKLEFILNKKTQANYKNMLGLEFDFTILTTNLVIFEDKIDISYTMFLDGDMISNHQISILMK